MPNNSPREVKSDNPNVLISVCSDAIHLPITDIGSHEETSFSYDLNILHAYTY